MADSFPWHILIAFELLYLSTSYPAKINSYRTWVLGPVAVTVALYLWTQTPLIEEPSLAYAVGFNISFRLCFMAYLVYFQDGFPDLCRRVKDGDQPPSTFPSWKKIGWMFDSAYGIRRVGWIQEPKDVYPPRPQLGSRIHFIIYGIAYTGVNLLILELIIWHQTGNPVFDRRIHSSTDGPEAYMQGQTLMGRIINPVIVGVAVLTGFRGAQMFIAVISVLLHLTEPEEWPDMVGLPTDTYTIRLYWGKMWHQTMRIMLSSIGKHVANKTFGFSRGTNLSAYTQLYIGFALSGLVHAGGDYMVARRLSLTKPSIRWFLLQAVGITLEDFFMWCTKSIRPNSRWLNRAIGTIWVTLWFAWTTPAYTDNMSMGGYGVGGAPCKPISDAVHYAFERFVSVYDVA